jgi:hypothetical protein
VPEDIRIPIRVRRPKEDSDERMGWLYSTMAPPPANDDLSWHNDRDTLATPAGHWDPPVLSGDSDWHPGIPSPSPFVSNRLGQLIVPRVPNRELPQKLAQHTEAAAAILNGLSRTGSIYRSGADTWKLGFFPRQVPDADSFQNELYFSLDSNSLAYKDDLGVTHPLY